MNSEEKTSNTTDDSGNNDNHCCDCMAMIQNFQKMFTGKSQKNDPVGCCTMMAQMCCGKSDGLEK
jgi:hypothetical protein